MNAVKALHDRSIDRARSPAPIEPGRDVLSSFAESSRREWQVRNGIGGFAAGTLCLLNTRRYDLLPTRIGALGFCSGLCGAGCGADQVSGIVVNCIRQGPCRLRGFAPPSRRSVEMSQHKRQSLGATYCDNECPQRRRQRTFNLRAATTATYAPVAEVLAVVPKHVILVLTESRPCTLYYFLR